MQGVGKRTMCWKGYSRPLSNSTGVVWLSMDVLPLKMRSCLFPASLKVCVREIQMAISALETVQVIEQPHVRAVSPLLQLHWSFHHHGHVLKEPVLKCFRCIDLFMTEKSSWAAFYTINDLIRLYILKSQFGQGISSYEAMPWITMQD